MGINPFQRAELCDFPAERSLNFECNVSGGGANASSNPCPKEITQLIPRIMVVRPRVGYRGWGLSVSQERGCFVSGHSRSLEEARVIV